MRSSNRNNDDTSQEEERRMNDTTMPPPRRPAVAAGTTATTATTMATATTTRKKKVIPPPPPRQNKKGFGLSDWNRLLRSSNDLALRRGQPLRQNMKWKEIRKHNKIHDGWIVLNKKQVYFISPYLAYHPGGSAILQKQVLGKDATILYNKYHRWVNSDNLIGKLLIGYVDPNDNDDSDSDSDDDEGGRGSYLSSNNQQQQQQPTTMTDVTTTADGFPVPAPRRPK